MVNARRMQLQNGYNRSYDSTKSYLPNVTHKKTEMHLASSTGEPVG